MISAAFVARLLQSFIKIRLEEGADLSVRPQYAQSEYACSSIDILGRSFPLIWWIPPLSVHPLASVDNNAFGSMFTYSRSGHAFGLVFKT
ncbi:hypothetical protein D3C77_127600 [compost metagenome]